MKDAQKPDHVSLITLISRIKEGRFVVPDFQREFKWGPQDIQDLMRSIFLDYYIGSLLLWKGQPPNFEALACEPIYGYQGPGSPEHIVLDGQQRLTAMYYAIAAPDIAAPNRANRYLYFLRIDQFMRENYDEAFEFDWTRRGTNLLENRPLQYERHIFPLAVLGQSGFELPFWVHDYAKHWEVKARSAEADGDEERAREARQNIETAHGFGQYLKELTEQYQISFIELDRDLELDKICDIFTQINSRGIRLDVFDLMNALLKPQGLQLKHLWREAAPNLSSFESPRMNVYVLQVMSILLQTYCSPKYLYYLLPGQQKIVRGPDRSLRKEILLKDPSEFKRHWSAAVEAMSRAMSMLRHPQEFGVTSSAYLPYVSILPVFAAIQVHARSLDPSRRLDAQRKIRHWYWASVFTKRYSGSVESTAARDFLDVKAWLSDDAAEPALLEELRSRFRDLELRNETKRGSSIYNGIFNLLVIGGARDWMTGNLPQYDELDDHHIVPKSWGKASGQGSLIDSILNRTPLTSDTNRNLIRDRLPNTYLPELIAKSGEPVVRTTFESHFISPSAFDVLLRDPFTPDDFEEFLVERQRGLQHAIEDLLVKERLDLTPHLRELDAGVEDVELRIRSLIEGRLMRNPLSLPTHVLQRANERIQTALRKNPGLNSDHYETLGGKLEYCDLRELQDTITGKALWQVFESRFGTKEVLATRFGQLAELRNGIRHNRAVDEVTRKDGEAAILWFNQVLPEPVAHN